jgi:hypothetical protein
MSKTNHGVVLQTRACNVAISAIAAFVILLSIGSAPGGAVAAPLSQEDFHSKVTEIYDFEPRNLKKDEVAAKSGQLDTFWSSASAAPQETLPLLRRELADPSNSAFFHYDGAKLLLSLSKEREDGELALQSISKADLRSLQPTDYLRTVHRLASIGLDSREAAFHILAFPQFQSFIVQHALTLGQNYSLIYMLFPMDVSKFSGDLLSHLASETDVTSQKSLLLAIWYTATPAGEAALKSFAENKDMPEESRTYASGLIVRKSSFLGALSFESKASLQEARRKIMCRPISDEALGEFDQITAKIRAKL